MDIKGCKISVDAGHTKDNTPDAGAVGVKNEYAMNVQVKELVIKKLRNLGALVMDCSVIDVRVDNPKEYLNKSLSHRTNTSNAFNANIHICIHHNCFNGNAHGAEVEYVSYKGSKLAQCIQNQFVKLGYTDRKIQKRNNLFVLNQTKAVCVLTECGFVDSKSDMLLYDPEKESQAIVDGIVSYLKPIIK